MWGNSNFKGRFDGKGTPTGSAGTTPASTPGVNTEKRKPYVNSLILALASVTDVVGFPGLLQVKPMPTPERSNSTGVSDESMRR